MKTEGRRQSGNIEDRRGQSAGGPGFPGGRMGAGGGLGLLVVIVLALVFGIDPRQIIDSGALQGPADGQVTTSSDSVPGQPYQETPEEAKRREFAQVVLADTEDTWKDLFAAAGRQYEVPILVLFTGAVQSACGFAHSAAGPFYCPGDRKLYLDLSFFDEMTSKLDAGGDFAMAYVIAHEVGHHVQTLLGTSGRVSQMRARAGEAEGNALSVKLELQADCLAGIWAMHTQKQKAVLEAGDIEEAMNAASAVGDDRLQKRAQGYVVPESFTHGSSAERASWFRKGLQTGEVDQCNTFGKGISQ